MVKLSIVHENVSPVFSVQSQTLSTHRKGFQNLHRNSQNIQKIWGVGMGGKPREGEGLIGKICIKYGLDTSLRKFPI